MTVATIVMTTWLPNNQDGMLRLQIIEKTLRSWHKNLINSDDIRLHVADDGSSNEMLKELQDIVKIEWPYIGTTYSQQMRKGVGASLNAGIREALKYSDFVLHMVDDWVLTKPLDIDPWVEALALYENIGGFRFFPHPDLTGRIRYIKPGIYAMELDRHHFAFATRPSLWHRRMLEAYGPFDEGSSAYECERMYNLNYCLTDGPSLYLALPDEWEHVGGVELGDITP